MKVLTPDDFLALTPYARGYIVYMMGSRDDQPYVPEEENPYPEGSTDWHAWQEGRQAINAVTDGEE